MVRLYNVSKPTGKWSTVDFRPSASPPDVAGSRAPANAALVTGAVQPGTAQSLLQSAVARILASNGVHAAPSCTTPTI